MVPLAKFSYYTQFFFRVHLEKPYRQLGPKDYQDLQTPQQSLFLLHSCSEKSQAVFTGPDPIWNEGLCAVRALPPLPGAIWAAAPVWALLLTSSVKNLCWNLPKFVCILCDGSTYRVCWVSAFSEKFICWQEMLGRTFPHSQTLMFSEIWYY